MKTGDTLLSVVVPCFNEEEALPVLLQALTPALDRATGGRWELVLVDDGSADRTGELITEANGRDPRVKGLLLSRNFGHQPALSAGIAYAAGDYVAVMDADLQDPVDVMAQCFEKARAEGLDVVYAVRRRRDANVFLNAGYRLFYRLMTRVADHPWNLDSGDFCVMSRRAVRLLAGLPENVRIVRGLRAWIGLKQAAVPYDRPRRAKGASKYSVWKLCLLALNSLVSFSSAPLRIVSTIGFAMSGTAFLFGGLMLINRLFPHFTLFGYYVGSSPGTATLVISLSIFASLLFLCLAIIGEYLAVILREIKRRPSVIVARRVGEFASGPQGDVVADISSS